MKIKFWAAIRRIFRLELPVEHFSKNCQMSLALSRRAASKCKQPEVKLEHVLVGILWLEDCSAQKVLCSLGVTKEQLLKTLDPLVQIGSIELQRDEIVYSTEIRRVLAQASWEASRCASKEICTQHFLLAFLYRGQGIVVQALWAHGLTWQSVYDRINRMPIVSNQAHERTATAVTPPVVPAPHEP